jgi:hypothetical protein
MVDFAKEILRVVSQIRKSYVKGIIDNFKLSSESIGRNNQNKFYAWYYVDVPARLFRIN